MRKVALRILRSKEFGMLKLTQLTFFLQWSTRSTLLDSYLVKEYLGA